MTDDPRSTALLPEIDVVILAWNDDDVLPAAVESAATADGVVTRVVVIDNASDTPVSSESFDGVVVVRNTANRGVAAARNQGVLLGHAPLVLILDSDARLEPGALGRMTTVMLEDESIGCVGPVFVGQSPEASAGKAPTLWTKLRRVSGQTATYQPVEHHADSWPVDFVIGACQLFRRSAYESIGGIDESFFYGPEDADFCMRLKLAGWLVVQVADAPVVHPPRRRHRNVLSSRGAAHSWAVVRFLWRHRRFERTTGA